MKKANLKQTWKSLMLLVMMMLTGSAAWAVDYNLWLANTRVTTENRNDLSVIDGVTGTVTYDKNSQTLSLTDATISYTYESGTHDGALFIGSNHLKTIEVNGNCSITCTGGCGIVDNSAMTITLTGNGKLTVNGTWGIDLRNISSTFVVDGPTLIANGTASGAYGIGGAEPNGDEYFSTLTVNSGVVEAHGSTGGSSIGRLLELNLGKDMYIAAPIGAKFYNHKVTTSDGANIISTVRIQHILAAPLTLEAIENGTVTIDNPLGLEIGYAVNNGNIQWKSDATISVTLYQGQTLALYGNNATYCNNSWPIKCTTIQCSADCYIYGNIMSLISSTTYENLKELTGKNTFQYLFSGNAHIKNHATKRLMLPATTLANGCYSSMFYSCTGLTSAPDLPATTLDDYCYSHMFEKCENLTTAPELPALQLKKYCYNAMFHVCNLTKAPVLRALKLEEGCYSQMLQSNPNLNEVTCLATDISATDCTYNWLYDVSETGTFTKAAGFTGWETGENGIPSGWTVEEDNTYKPCELAFSTDAITVTYGDNIEEMTPVLSNPNSLPVTYTSSTPSVATVDPSTGKLTILTEGTTTITATFTGNSEYYGGNATYKLTVIAKGEEPVFAFDREALLITKGKGFIAPTLNASEGLTTTYSSNNNGVVSVNSTTGVLTVNGYGVAIITATTPGNLQYAGATAKYYVMVLKSAEAVRSDVNGDGTVTAQDASLILQYIAGKISW